MASPQSEKPNMKPARQVAGHEILNGFAHVSGSVNAGTFVIITVADPDSNPQTMLAGDREGQPSRAYSPRWENAWKLRSSTSGEVPVGITLNDVREYNSYGDRYVHHKEEVGRLDLVISGQAVPVAMRGIFEINGFSGAPGPMSGAIAHPTEAGQLLVSNASTGQIGKFLTNSGADGYALFKVEL
jgi:hypothetical protein